MSSRKLTEQEKRQLALGDVTPPTNLREDPYAAPFDYADHEEAPGTAPVLGRLAIARRVSFRTPSAEQALPATHPDLSLIHI